MKVHWWTRIWHTYFCNHSGVVGMCPVMIEYYKQKESECSDEKK